MASLQWIGAKIEPGRWPACIETLRTALPSPCRDFGKAAVDKPCSLGVGGVYLDERLRRMGAKTRTCSRPCHRMPLVAHAAGIEAQWKGLAGCSPHARPFGCNEARAPIAGEETARAEKALLAAACRRPAPATSPDRGRHRPHPRVTRAHRYRSHAARHSRSRTAPHAREKYRPACGSRRRGRSRAAAPPR